MCLKFGFVFFWRKDFGAKAAHKMLVKLTPSKRFQQSLMRDCKEYLRVDAPLYCKVS
jgi:hypothetical protein